MDENGKHKFIQFNILGFGVVKVIVLIKGAAGENACLMPH
jgi:hypothetical protein